MWEGYHELRMFESGQLQVIKSDGSRAPENRKRNCLGERIRLGVWIWESPVVQCGQDQPGSGTVVELEESDGPSRVSRQGGQCSG